MRYTSFRHRIVEIDTWWNVNFEVDIFPKFLVAVEIDT
mgnify:CR=1 FL=1